MKDTIKMSRHRKESVKKGKVSPKPTRFKEFTQLMRKMALEETEEHSMAEAHKGKNTGLVQPAPEDERHIYFVLEDLVKKIIRFRNQRRETDLVKLAMSAYLLWLKLYPKQKKGGGSL